VLVLVSEMRFGDLVGRFAWRRCGYIGGGS
jgi:hypothetical protein